MTTNEATELLKRYREGRCTPAEAARVDAWFDSLVRDRSVQPAEADYARLFAESFDYIAQHREPTPMRRLRRWLPYVAAAVLVVATAAWLFYGGQTGRQEEIPAGGNRATLTLADGRVINLDEGQTGIIVGAEDITYQDGSTLAAVIPSAAEESLPNPGDGSVMLLLTTPKGGTYAITLPDGSKVWLNANSTLKYPSRFSDASREVLLEGEAFFDIVEMQGTRDTRAPASNLKSSAGARVSRVPFKVKTNNQTVEVLGTQFNLSAYADDPETKTTLVEGKVKILTGAVGVGANKHSPNDHAPNESGVTLTPGEQSIVQNDGIQINTVDIAPIIAWQRGYFRFAEDLERVMKQVARWYDVTVVFKDESLKGVGVLGTVNRNRQLSELLTLLEQVTEAKFKVVVNGPERRVEVMR